jgi:GDSL-like Lipase/Acylhydrolase family
VINDGQTEDMMAGGASRCHTLAVLGGRVLLFAWLIAWALGYSVLQTRLARGPIATIAFHVAYVMGVAAVLVIFWKANALLEVVIHSVRTAPAYLTVLLVNGLVCAFLVLNIFTQVGVIALILSASLGAMALALLARPRRRRLTDSILRSSPLSFLSVYFCLGAGEIVLRFNPMLVGGGGGGNPALRQLYAGLYPLNSHGLRGEEFETAPRPGTFRILATGDSFTFGQGVRFEETYPHLMENLLNQAGDSLKYEVINAGQQGWSTVDELRFLQEEGLDYDPSLIIVQFYLNDVAGHFEGRDEIANEMVKELIQRPLARSYVVFFLKYRFDQVLGRLAGSRGGAQSGDHIERLATVVAEEGLGWRQCTSALAEIGVLSRETGVPVTLVIFPMPGRRVDHSVTTITEAVTTQAHRAGLHVLDLSEAFASIPVRDQIVSEIDHHPGPAVHRVAAGRIVDFLRSTELLVPAPRVGSPSDLGRASSVEGSQLRY